MLRSRVATSVCRRSASWVLPHSTVTSIFCTLYFCIFTSAAVRALDDVTSSRENPIPAYSRCEFAKTAIPADSLVGPSAGVPMYPKKSALTRSVPRVTTTVAYRPPPHVSGTGSLQPAHATVLEGCSALREISSAQTHHTDPSSPFAFLSMGNALIRFDLISWGMHEYLKLECGR